MTRAELLHLRWEDPTTLLEWCARRMCQAPGCVKLRRSVSYCGMHDMRFLRHNDTTFTAFAGPNPRVTSFWMKQLKRAPQSTKEIALKTSRTITGVQKAMRTLERLGIAERLGTSHRDRKWRLKQDV